MATAVVRPATDADIPALSALAARIVTPEHYLGARWSPPRFETFIQGLMGLEFGKVLVLEHSGRIIGAAGLMHVTVFFAEETLVQGVFIWSDPSYPGRGAALVRAVEDWARERGADRVLLFANEQNGRAYETSMYLAKRGYIKSETGYTRSL